ncbi:MAG: protein phosphatase 2C domain-containing protein [Vicinamibacterales bacterium]
MSDALSVAVGDSLIAAWRTDPGRVRTNNEDLPLVDASRGVYGVIDGVGGQAAGEVAAGIARDVILQRLARPLGTPSERVREALAIANNEIFRRAEDAPALRGMACVVTLAIVAEGAVTIGHVGDTRLYKLRPGGLRKLTHDHSPVGEREDAQELSELDAMRHPRRNEVFRDLGSAYRDKDEDEFVEVIVEPFDRDCAILLCSDGLTDMVSSAVIDAVVHRYAGRPQAVADALVAAANDAGGKDNVTVVYAEGPDFAAAIRRQRVDGAQRAGQGSTAAPSDGTRDEGQVQTRTAGEPPRPSRSLARRVIRSRTTWFFAGALVGIAAALGAAWRMGTLTLDRQAPLVVDPAAATGFRRIADAMAAARPGDLVRVEPGVYEERVFLPNGVDLAARIPGTVVLARPSNASGEVVAISAFGASSSSVSGITIESTPALPISIGIRITGQGVTLDQLWLKGEMRAAVDVAPTAGVQVRGSTFAVQGPAVALGDESNASLTGNVFLRTGRPGDVPFSLSPTSQAVFRNNVFAGFGTEVVKGMPPAVRQQLLAGNYVVACEPSLLR